MAILPPAGGEPGKSVTKANEVSASVMAAAIATISAINLRSSVLVDPVVHRTEA